MTTQLNPYLNLLDDARQTMDFYQSVFGGEVTRSTFADSQLSEDPAERDRVMHSILESEGGLVLMAADTPAGMEFTPGRNGSLSLSGDNEAALSGFYERLAEGGTVTMPLDASPSGDLFGMCTDRFGVGWLVNIAVAPS